MARQEESTPRRAPETTAVSNADSSSATPRFAVDSEGATLPGIDSAGATRPGAPTDPAGGKPSSRNKVSSSDARAVGEGSGSRPSSESSSVFRSIGATVFREGDILGERYEITKLLGMGGMGAVYKAHDIKVERTVGLKVIRPDLAENPPILARFKQELILARQITHKNIIRIYDLNEANGVNF